MIQGLDFSLIQEYTYVDRWGSRWQGRLDVSLRRASFETSARGDLPATVHLRHP